MITGRLMETSVTFGVIVLSTSIDDLYTNSDIVVCQSKLMVFYMGIKL